MKRINTTAIVLARTDYGEADRILTLLTPNEGKIKGIAKGVRKSKSKMAGGIELFSISEISYIIGKSEINTIISTRLLNHYGAIVKDMDRTTAAYDFIKIMNKATEDNPEPGYFDLLKNTFESLNDNLIDLNIIKTWFEAQLLKLAGHSPNLKTDQSDNKLLPGHNYIFNYDKVCFQADKAGKFSSDQIKFLRLVFSDNLPKTLQKISRSPELAIQAQQLVGALLQNYVRL